MPVFQDSVLAAKETGLFRFKKKTSKLMPYREITAVCSEKNTKRIKVLCE